VKHISAGKGLSNIAESIESAISTLASSIESVTGSTSMTMMTSLVWKAGAISAIKKDEGLSKDEFDATVELIMSSSNVANTYLAIGKTTSHICSILNFPSSTKLDLLLLHNCYTSSKFLVEMLCYKSIILHYSSICTVYK